MIRIFFPLLLLGVSLMQAVQQEPSQATEPEESSSDAVYLSWDVRVTDEEQNNQYPHTVMQYNVRLKILTDRGKDRYGTLEIPYFGKTNISQIGGRTLKPDGSAMELSRDAIFDKSVVRAGGIKVRVKSFAMPAVTPGAIIEYHWLENREDQLANFVRLPVQFDMPVEEVTYHLKPVTNPWLPYHMRLLPFNCQAPAFQPERNGYYSLSMRNVPAFHREPQMPPEDQIRQWVLIYYEKDNNLPPDKYWNALGRDLYQHYKQEIKVNEEVKRLADSAVEDAKTPDEKLARLVAYCRKNLKDVAGPEITTEERENAKRNNNTLDTLRNGEGTRSQINLAFLALATAEGFDARVARLPDRGDTFFDKRILMDYFLRAYNIAVNLDGKWRFYDVANKNLPIGMLRWQEEGVEALVTDPKDPVFVKTQVTPAEKSRVSRIADCSLSAEGALECSVREILDGHEALQWRSRFAGESTAEREAALRRQMRARFAEIRVTEINFNIPDDVSKGASFTYRISLAGYAQRTGKRLFVAPAVFQTGLAARFTESKRQYPVYFHYPWSEYDSIRIKLPENFELDHADAPPSLKFSPAGEYKVHIAVANGQTLEYQREFAMGADGTVLFDQQNYPVLKRVFEQVHERDGHVITLKTKEGAVPPVSNQE